MTPAQLTTFKAHILANAGVATMLAANDHIGIAADYNTTGTGSVWRPDVRVEELNTAIVWSEYSALTALFQNCYMTMISPGVVNMTSANMRSGLGAMFALATNTKNNMIAMAQRVPTKFEMVFTTANVCSLYGMAISANDVAQALGS